MRERLQKLISTAGIASRRHAEELIGAGRVTINGQVVNVQGVKADPETDHIKVDGRLINPLLRSRKDVYVLLNKPRGCLASLADPQGRPLVTDLLPSSLGRLHPVGRLDFNTEGLLLLTNNGKFTNFITSAANGVEKVYEVKVKGVPAEDAVSSLRRGVILNDGIRTAPAIIRKSGESEANTWFEVILHEGRNQQIRKMFDAINHPVLKLRRVRIGFLGDENLAPGRWRFLSIDEVTRLMSKSGRRKRVGKTGKHLASHASSTG